MQISTLIHSIKNLMAVLPNTQADVDEKHRQTAIIAHERLSDTAVYARLLKKPFDRVVTDKEKLNNLLTCGDMQSFHREWDSQKARRWLATHDVSLKMNVLNALMLKRTSETTAVPSSGPLAETPLSVAAANAAGFKQRLSQIGYDVHAASNKEKSRSLLDNFDDVVEASKYETLSSREICQSVADAIKSMAEDYLDIFQQAVEKNAAFYSDFSDFMAKLKDFISAKDDKTILNASSFLNELNALMAKYPVPGEATTLYPVQDGRNLKGADKEECEAWAKEMGLDPKKCVTKLANGTYIVHIDTGPLDKIKSSASSGGSIEYNSAQWAAWQSGLDIHKDSIQTAMQTLTQKYSNANSTFDNLVKVLSSTIASLLDCDKSFFNI